MKNYYEYLAKLILEKAFPEFGIFHIKDKPDLVSFDNAVGIEVTALIDPKEAEAASFFTRIIKVQQEKTPQVKMDSFLKNGYELLSHNGKIVGYASDGYCWPFSKLQNTIFVKNAKLNNYHSFHSQRLFIYFPVDTIEEDYLNNFWDMVDMDFQEKILFDYIYFFMNNKLWIIDIKTKKNSQIEIDTKDFAKQAKQYVRISKR